MATYTSHYNLKKPATSDKIRIADFNGNADTIDATMYNNASIGAQLKADIGIVENTNTATHNISAGQYVIWKGDLYTASSAISTGATLSTANLTAVSGGGLNALNSKITNNYTDYNSNGNYHVRVTQLGKMVIVSGEVFGKGTEGYITDIALPTPFGYDGGTELLANAVIFYARNQTTGAIQQMRTGADYYIYREAAMTNGQPYAFAFSYCKQ